MNDFIWHKQNVFSLQFCKLMIDYFDRMDAAGFTRTRKQNESGINKTIKDDTSLIIQNDFVNGQDLDLTKIQQISSEFLRIFWDQCYGAYASEFDILSQIGPHSIQSLRLQKTKIGGGYHIWHCENGHRSVSERILSLTVYLNTVEEGGETEFLYYPKRVKAVGGSVLIFPAGFTHTHRGNPPISNEKYIITGWVEF